MIEPHLVPLSWTLIHFLWQAPLLLCIALVADHFVARRENERRYVLQLVALFSMPIAAAATLLIEETRTLDVSLLMPERYVQPFVAVHVVGIAQSTAPQLARIDVGRLSAGIDMLWVAGIVLLSVRTIGGWWMIRGLRATSSPFLPGRTMRWSSGGQNRELTRAVLLRLSRSVAGPMTTGFRRPIVFLPAASGTSLEPAELDAVLAHEFAHIEREDYRWNLIQTAIETLLFFHPAIWLLGGSIRRLRERCCDDRAVRSCGDAVMYANALLHLEEGRTVGGPLAMAWDGHRPDQLFARIANVLGERCEVSLPVRFAGLVSAAAVAVAIATALYLHAFGAALPPATR
jgi:beta-lactamase regulating signal transducer with metallopeptidase domain